MKDEAGFWIGMGLIIAAFVISNEFGRPTATEPEFRAWEKITGNTNRLTFEEYSAWVKARGRR